MSNPPVNPAHADVFSTSSTQQDTSDLFAFPIASLDADHTSSSDDRSSNASSASSEEEPSDDEHQHDSSFTNAVEYHSESESPFEASQAGPPLGRSARVGRSAPPPLVPAPVPAVHRALEYDGALSAAPADARTLATSLSTGPDSARMLALFEAAQLLPAGADVVAVQVLPVIAKDAHRWQPATQAAAAETVLKVFATGACKRANIEENLVAAALRVLKSVTDGNFEHNALAVSDTDKNEATQAWAHVLAQNLPRAEWPEGRAICVWEVVDALNGTLAAKVLGALAERMGIRDVVESVLPRAVAIADMGDVDTKASIAECYGGIAKALSISHIERVLWNCVKKLVDDPDARVHTAALRSVASITENAGLNEHDLGEVLKKGASGAGAGGTLHTKLIPAVFLRECAVVRKVAGEDQRVVQDGVYLTLEINAEIFGKMVVACYAALNEDAARKEVYKAFVAMATCNGPVVRRYCAFNIPGVCSKLVGKFRSELADIVEFLSQDSDAETRCNLAAGMHETVRLLASHSTANALYNAVRALLQDSDERVRENALSHFDELVTQLAMQKGYSADARLTPLFENLHTLSSGNWRSQETLASHLRLAAPLVPPPTLRSHVLPLLYRLAESSPSQVRKASMAAVASCLRYLSDTVSREVAMAAFIRQWAGANVYWMRMAFLDAADSALDSYSRILFRDTFGAAALKLAQDPVSNVRLRVARLLPRIAPSCHIMQDFSAASASLRADSDVDVREAAGQLQGNLIKLLESARSKFEEDLLREEQELELYAKHLSAQLNANKKRNPVKRTKSLIIGKAKKGLSTPKLSITEPPSNGTLGVDRSPAAELPLSPVTPLSISSVQSPSSRTAHRPFQTPRKANKTAFGEDANASAAVKSTPKALQKKSRNKILELVSPRQAPRKGRKPKSGK